MTITNLAQGVGVALMLLGCLLTLITAVGLLRLPDLLARMHAATKPQVLGLLLLCLGAALVLQSPRAAATLALVFILQLITAPISAHMLSNTAFKSNRIEASSLLVDEFTQDIETARKREEKP